MPDGGTAGAAGQSGTAGGAAGAGSGTGAGQSNSNSTEGQQQGTSGGDGVNTAAGQSGAGTQTAQTGAQQVDITQTAEFKAAVTKAIENKLPQLRKAIAKEISGEKDGQPSVEELQRGKETAETSLRFYQARDAVEDFTADKKNAAPIKNVRAFCRYFKDDFEFDDKGKVTNLKDLYTRAKLETPELLGTGAGSIDANAGANGQPGVQDMNALLRAGRR